MAPGSEDSQDGLKHTQHGEIFELKKEVFENVVKTEECCTQDRLWFV